MLRFESHSMVKNLKLKGTASEKRQFGASGIQSAARFELKSRNTKRKQKGAKRDKRATHIQVPIDCNSKLSFVKEEKGL